MLVHLRLHTRKALHKSGRELIAKYAKQSGGRGQYGHCKVRFEPMDANAEEVLMNSSTAVTGGAIPKEYIPAVGCRYSKKQPKPVSLAGYPCTWYQSYLFMMVLTMKSIPVKWHLRLPVLWPSRMRCTKVVLFYLEPIMRVEVTVPDDYMGDVIGDISSRRGRIEGTEDIGCVLMVNQRFRSIIRDVWILLLTLRSKNTGPWKLTPCSLTLYEPVPKNSSREGYILIKVNNLILISKKLCIIYSLCLKIFHYLKYNQGI